MRPDSRREAGSALIVTVLLMLLLGAIGLNALDTVMRDQQVAGFQNRSSSALYAAEAGLAAAKNLVRQNVFSMNEVVAFATYDSPVQISDSSAFPHGQPRYFGDPDVANPIESLPETLKVPGGGGSNMRVGTGANWGNYALWRIRVQGETADGAVSKLESVATNQMPSGY